MSIDIGSEIAGYKLLRPIGEGGMARVFLAERVSDGEQAALKILREEVAGDDDFRRRFVRESRYVDSLDHPNIVPVHEAGEADGLAYIAMEYVEGSDLYVLLQAGPLSPETTVRMLSQVASALDAAHAAGILHRDVKPANVLIASAKPGRPERCCLTDFGLGKQVTKDSVSLTEAGKFVGTLAYTAPEEILGKELDARTDVYSLGCLLFECLAGEPPFTGTSEVEIMKGHIQDRPPKVAKKRSGVPAALNGVLETALAKDPAERYGSCTELIGAAAAAIGVPEGAAELTGAAPDLTGAADTGKDPMDEKLRLRVTKGNAAGREIHVEQELLIGRLAPGDGKLADDVEISREHARIARDPAGTFSITDLGSTNGTFVNGRRVETQELLSPGDTIEVGATTLVVQVSMPSTPPSTEVPSQPPAPPPVEEAPAPTAEPPEAPAAEPPEAPAAELPEAPVAEPPETPGRAPVAPLSLRLELDPETGRGSLAIEGSPDPVELVYEDGRWRVVT